MFSKEENGQAPFEGRSVFLTCEDWLELPINNKLIADYIKVILTYFL